jgi:flagellar basal-body rod protein FlgB
MPSIVDGTTIPLLEKIATFGERRNTVLAGNVANIDTPNYRRQDLPIEDFERALRGDPRRLGPNGPGVDRSFGTSD